MIPTSSGPVILTPFFILCAIPWLALGADQKPRKTTYTYKTVDQCAIKADVYAPPGDQARPVVLHIHGGALIVGSREGIDRKLLDLLLDAGYVVVSIDYRLAPETKLPAILEDVEDACKWVREKGPKLFHADPDRLGVMGGSAGGYLTLSTGFRVEPKPKALVAFWGYGDVVGDWYSKPDPFYVKQPAVPREEAYQAVGGSVLSETIGKTPRSRFYLYCRQNGLWPKEVTGHDPAKEPKVFDAFCPIRNVTSKYPPTLMIHGTKDTDVPYELSADMAKELKSKGVEHELMTIDGAGHGLSGAKPEVIAKTQARAFEFLKRHLQ